MPVEEPAAPHNVISGGIQFGPVLQGRDIHATFQLPVATPVALAQLPAPVADFVGRGGELAVLAGLLDPARIEDAVVVSAVAGLAGVGKTALAVQAGHAASGQGWFSGGMLFLDLHGYDDQRMEPGQALDALLRALGVPAEHIPPDVDGRGGLYRSVLAQIREPVLVIADNASSEAQVRPLLPGVGPHKVLITSRHTLAGVGARLVDVTVLDDEAAIELLNAALRAARPEDDRITSNDEAASQLTQMCGGLPLALQITAALLKANPMLSTADLADELTVEQERLDQLAYDDGSGTAGLSVAAAFELSYRRLDALSARVFRLLPVNPGPDVSTAAVAILADLPVSKVRKVLAELTHAHLAEATPGAAGRWQMHDLLRLYARRLGEKEADADGREQALDRLLGYYMRSADAAHQHLRPRQVMPAPGEFDGTGGALEWLDAQRASLVAAVSLAAATGRSRVAILLPFYLNPYFNWRRRFDDMLATSTVSLDWARRLGERAAEAGALNMLGTAYMWLEQVGKAITAHEDALAIYRETGDRHGEGVALDEFANALQRAGRFEEAITAQQDAAAIFHATRDRYDEGVVLSNLSIALSQAGRSEEAITALQGSVAICREIGDQQGKGQALGNLGIALRGAGRLEEAITAWQDAAGIFRETGDRHGEAQTLAHLSESLNTAKRPEEAIAASGQDLVIRRKIDDRHGEGNALRNLGMALQQADRFDEAITALQKSVAIYQETSDRDGEGLAQASLGETLRRADRPEDAIIVLQDSIAICRETGDRGREGDVLNDLGLALRQRGRSEEAIITLRDSVALCRETGHRRAESIALNSLGAALWDVGRFEEAIPAYEGAATICRETRDRHVEGTALINLGDALREVGRFDEAVTACQDAAAIFRETGDRHGEGMALKNLGDALREVGRFDEAVTACQDAAAIFRETGDRHGEGMALNSLGIALEPIGRFDDAITAYQDAAAIFQEIGDERAEGITLGNAQKARAAQPT